MIKAERCRVRAISGPSLGLQCIFIRTYGQGSFGSGRKGDKPGAAGDRLLKANLTSFQRNCQLPLHLCLLLSHANELSPTQLKPRQRAALRAVHVFVRLAGNGAR